MNKKVIYLFLALALPGLFFLFLKFYGHNQFDIPVYFEKGVPKELSACGLNSNTQYFLPDSVLKAIGWNNEIALITVGTSENDHKELTRLLKELKLAGLRIFSLDSIQVGRLKQWKSCVFFLKEPWKLVLIDSQKRIRGYYVLDSREELERLEVELEILLRKY